MADGDGVAEVPDRVTIYEVARRAGVSIATVSHTINRPHKVSAATRERVMQVIDELQFVPKAEAANQARKGVGRIGVLAPFTSYESYRTRLVGVLEECADEALDVVVFDHASVAAATSPLLSALPASGRLDGLLIMGVPLDDRMADRLRKRKLATVLVDSFHPDFSSVNVDDEAGGYAVGAHLVDRGHRTFAFVSEGQRSVDYDSPGQKRLRGFVRALGAAGLGRNDMNFVITSSDVRGGRAAVADLLALEEPPTAIWAHHDDLAAGLLGGLRDAGRSVPGDFAVVGYDGGDLAEALDLTTVVQPFAETGRLAAAMLRAAIAGESRAIQHVNLRAELSAGGTT